VLPERGGAVSLDFKEEPGRNWVTGFDEVLANEESASKKGRACTNPARRVWFVPQIRESILSRRFACIACFPFCFEGFTP
jgi:hypothetical protein